MVRYVYPRSKQPFRSQAASYTKTFTINTVIKKNLTKTFTIDTVIKKAATKTFTIDAVIAISGTKTFTIDSVIKKNLTKTFTIDAVIKKNLTKTFTIDSVIKKNLTKTFIIDSVIKKAFTKTFTIDTVISSGVSATKTFTIDAVIAAATPQVTFGAGRKLKQPKPKPQILDLRISISAYSNVTRKIDNNIDVSGSFTYDLIQKMTISSGLSAPLEAETLTESKIIDSLETDVLSKSIIYEVRQAFAIVESKIKTTKITELRKKLLDLAKSSLNE